jgi:hypothetical protein
VPPAVMLLTHVWRFLIQTSAGTVDILTDGFHDFPQFLQANARVVTQLCYTLLLPNLYSSVIHPFDGI